MSAVPGRFLTLVVSGAPLARRTADLVAATTAAGWTTSVIGTPSARGWLDVPAVEAAGAPVWFEFRGPDEPKKRPDPHALAVCPATFNLVNKIVTASADTYALAAVAEALGMGVPVAVVPMVGPKLWAHPVWEANLGTLTVWGATLVDVRTGDGEPQPAAGDDVAAAFDPAWLVRALPAA